MKKIRGLGGKEDFNLKKKNQKKKKTQKTKKPKKQFMGLVTSIAHGEVWQYIYLPPKYCPDGVHILHWPWYMPVFAGDIMFTLRS